MIFGIDCLVFGKDGDGIHLGAVFGEEVFITAIGVPVIIHLGVVVVVVIGFSPALLVPALCPLIPLLIKLIH